MTLAEHIEWMTRLDREIVAVQMRPMVRELDAVMASTEQRWPIRRPTFFGAFSRIVGPS